jgi:hypothetical protein
VSLILKSLVFGIFAQFARGKHVEDTRPAQERDIHEKATAVSLRQKQDQVSVRADETVPVPVNAIRGTSRDHSY